jgi:hypothetical protein
MRGTIWRRTPAAPPSDTVTWNRHIVRTIHQIGGGEAHDVGEEESRRVGQLARQQRNDTRRVGSDRRDGADESGGEGDDEETVDDEEEEESGHEGDLDRAVERDSLELRKHYR